MSALKKWLSTLSDVEQVQWDRLVEEFGEGEAVLRIMAPEVSMLDVTRDAMHEHDRWSRWGVPIVQNETVSPFSWFFRFGTCIDFSNDLM